MRKLVYTLGLATLAACGAVDGMDEATGDTLEVAAQSQALESCNRWVPVVLDDPKIYAYRLPGMTGDDEFGGNPVSLVFRADLELRESGTVYGRFSLVMQERNGAFNGDTHLENAGAPWPLVQPLWAPPGGCTFKKFAWTREDDAGRPPISGLVKVDDTQRHNAYDPYFYWAIDSRAQTSALLGASCVTDSDGGIFGGSDAGKVYCRPEFNGFWAWVTDGSTAADHIVPPPPPAMLPPEHLAPIDVLVGPGGRPGALSIAWTPQGGRVDSYDIETSGDCAGPLCSFTRLVSALGGEASSYTAQLTPGAWYNVRVCSSSWGRRLCSAEAYGQARRSQITPPRCQAGWYRCDDLSCVPRVSMCEFLP
jgi:hypothetical protein